MNNFLPLRFLLFLFLLSCSSFPQRETEQITSIHIVDRNGLTETIHSKERLKQYEKNNFLNSQPYHKITRTYKKDSLGNTRSCISSYHPNGQAQQYLEALNSRAYGKYTEWFSNGNLRLKAFVIAGIADLNTLAEESWLFDGNCFVWNEDGSLEALIRYSKGELQGTSEYYHDKKTLWKSVPYEKGKVHGTVLVFKESGEILQKSEFQNGKKTGKTLRFWKVEQIAAEEEFQDDLLLSGKYFDREGKLISSIANGKGTRVSFGKNFPYEMQEFQDGEQEGKVQVFDSENNLSQIYHIKNGLKHGEDLCFYSKSSRPKISILWHEGMINGTVKTWYKNGILESQKEISSNKKNGLSTAWYKNGSVCLIEKYENDKLIRGEYFQKDNPAPLSTISNGSGESVLFDSNGNFLRRVSYSDGKPSS